MTTGRAHPDERGGVNNRSETQNERKYMKEESQKMGKEHIVKEREKWEAP